MKKKYNTNWVSRSLCIALCLGMILQIFTLEAASVKAFNHEQRVACTKLRLHLPELQAMSQGITDKKLQADVDEVIRYSQKVLKAGSHAKYRSVKKALASTLKAIEYIKHNQPSKELDKLTIETAVSAHFAQIKKDLVGVVQTLQANSLYSVPVAITSLPYTISRPGKYYLARNLVYNGSGTAITVTADNVILDFYANSITLANKSAVGVSVQGVHEFTLENGTIQGSLKSLLIAQSAGLHILNSFFSGGRTSVTGSQSVAFSGCSFEGADAAQSSALVLDTASKHISITNCTFSNWQNTIAANDVTGLIVSGCLIKGSAIAGGPIVTLGTNTTQANDTQLRNTTFLQDTLIAGFDGLLLCNGSNCLLEDCIVDVTTGHTASYQPAAVRIGSVGFDNVLAKNCIIKGANEYGLYIENGSHTTCLSCQFTDASITNVLLEAAKSCVIKSCKISDAFGSGVIVQSAATGNAIVACEVSNNGQNGIVVVEGAQKNQIIKNDVFDNANYGILNSDSSTATLSNISCNNAVSDCPMSGISPEQAPGVATVVPGSNVCCVP